MITHLGRSDLRPGRSAARRRRGAQQSRGLSSSPGSAERHFVPRRVRDT